MTQDFNHEKHQRMKLHNEYWILFFAKARGKEQSKGLKEETMSTGNQALPKLPKWPWRVVPGVVQTKSRTYQVGGASYSKASFFWLFAHDEI